MMVERTMERPLEKWSPSLGAGEPLGQIRLCPLVFEPHVWFYNLVFELVSTMHVVLGSLVSY